MFVDFPTPMASTGAGTHTRTSNVGICTSIGLFLVLLTVPGRLHFLRQMETVSSAKICETKHMERSTCASLQQNAHESTNFPAASHLTTCQEVKASCVPLLLDYAVHLPELKNVRALPFIHGGNLISQVTCHMRVEIHSGESDLSLTNLWGCRASDSLG